MRHLQDTVRKKVYELKESTGALACLLTDSKGFPVAGASDKRDRASTLPLQFFFHINRAVAAQGVGRLKSMILETDGGIILVKSMNMGGSDILLSMALATSTPMGMAMLEIENFESQLHGLLSKKGGGKEEPTGRPGSPLVESQVNEAVERLMKTPLFKMLAGKQEAEGEGHEA